MRSTIRQPRDHAGTAFISEDFDINRFAIRRKFWAVAANKNSSCAPLKPRSRNLSSFRMRFKMGKQHLRLFTILTRLFVRLRLDDLPRHIARLLMDTAGNLANR